MASPITVESAGGEYMESVVVLDWAIKIGELVREGDLVVTVETAKAATEVEASRDGFLTAIYAETGSEIGLNEPLGLIGTDQNDTAQEGLASEAEGHLEVGAKLISTTNATSARNERPAIASPAARKAAAVAGINLSQIGPSSPTGRIKLRDLERAAPTERARVSPLARRLAAQADFDLAGVVGSGSRGRVVKADVESLLVDNSVSNIATHRASRDGVAAKYEADSYEVIPADGMRRTLATRLTNAKRDVPHFYLTSDVKLDAILDARTRINKNVPLNKEGKPDYKLSINDFIVKAWALALQQVPDANATWAEDAILRHKHSDIAVAIAVPGGLYTPVVRKAETKSLRQISAEVKDFATRAQSRKLIPAEYSGGSSSVSNLGMFGVKHFTSIINPPHGTIISIGAGEERLFPKNGEAKIGMFMTISVSCDHRAVDGALGAQLMSAFKAFIEQPMMMLA